METTVLAMLIAVGLWGIKSREQRRRVTLLAGHLGQYQIEPLMQRLNEGYQRCLGENDASRRAQIWQLLEDNEKSLASQFERFAKDFARVDASQARASKLPVGLPLAEQLLPAAAFFDVREAFAIHARGIADAAANVAGLDAKDKAFRMSAEMLLMQHTCHWFCRSRAVASARLMARHQTPHALAIASVGPTTRKCYKELTGA